MQLAKESIQNSCNNVTLIFFLSTIECCFKGKVLNEYEQRTNLLAFIIEMKLDKHEDKA